jgi:hypothetical protein
MIGYLWSVVGADELRALLDVRPDRLKSGDRARDRIPMVDGILLLSELTNRGSEQAAIW